MQNLRIAVYGGSFNPPHLGHVEAAREAARELKADKLIVVPTARPPHKETEVESPTPEERFALAQLAFGDIPNVEVSDMELRRPGPNYTVDTLEAIHAQYPNAVLYLLIGEDMFLSFEEWKDYRRIMELAELAVFLRTLDGDVYIRGELDHYEVIYGARCTMIGCRIIEISSTELREQLRNRGGNEFVPENVYEEIVRKRYYGAQPNFDWLRKMSYACLEEKRIAHVQGCEQEAVRLAERWGADRELAAEAAILHDVTKKFKGPEQLHLCEEYGIITDIDEKANYKLLHAKTGAAFAREHFGVCDEVYNAILWHTTGHTDMTLLEKILYLADYIEPTRDFAGVEILRKLAYEDLDAAIIKGLEMSLDEVSQNGGKPHKNTVSALNWIREHRKTTATGV
ncbi:MAG: nicotinate (nicotinamide) nucleotide adenylyltransferase [Oscillospiraceae bacterium]|jgi:nicotinate-nucleotide adenylyltransferase